MHKSVNQTDVLSLKATYRYLDKLFTVLANGNSIGVDI